MRRRSFIQAAGGAASLPLLQACGGGDSADDVAIDRQMSRRAMAPAGSRLYAGASGSTVYGGLFGASILDLIAAVPANSWIQLNTNVIFDVFPPLDFLPQSSQSGPGTPTAVIRCWSSFAWDPLRSRLIIYGGGHANYDGNEVYVFDASTRQWTLGFYPSDTTVVTGAEYVTVDGSLHSPVSAHTYDNTAYLPILDRYITFGGAAAHTGGSYTIYEGGPVRNAGPYTLDLTHAGKGWVAGQTGSNVHRNSSANVDLPGANAWAVRDYYKDHADPNGVLSGMTSHISCGTVYAQENGHDVLYFTSRPGLHLHRVEFVDQDYRNDVITRVGIAANSPNQWDATLALDPVKRIILILGSNSQSLFWGWDISGAPKANFNVFSSGLTGPGATAWLAAFRQMHGIDFDPINNRFVMWSEGGEVFGISHNGGDLSSNWHVEQLLSNTGTAGVDRPKTRAELDIETFGVYSKSDTGVTGKWQWASDLNVFVGLQNTYFGNVWIYKPHNWSRPSPAAGTSVHALQAKARSQAMISR